MNVHNVYDDLSNYMFEKLNDTDLNDLAEGMLHALFDLIVGYCEDTGGAADTYSELLRDLCNINPKNKMEKL